MARSYMKNIGTHPYLNYTILIYSYHWTGC